MSADKASASGKEPRMSIVKHLKEMRNRLIIIAASLLVGSIVFYYLAPQVSKILLLPVARYFNNPYGLPLDELITQTYLLHALDAFALKFYIGFVTSIVVTSPIWLWQVLAYFLPAMRPRERKWFIPTLTVAILLFIGGIVFCYFVILDPAFGFLLGQAEGFAIILPETASYIDTVLVFLVAFGIAFELPLVIFFLTVFSIVPYKTMRKSWRMVYVVLLILCAFVTPDASPVTMLLMFGALILLYEGSLLLSRIVLARRIKAREQADAAYAATRKAR